MGVPVMKNGQFLIFLIAWESFRFKDLTHRYTDHFFLHWTSIILKNTKVSFQNVFRIQYIYIYIYIYIYYILDYKIQNITFYIMHFGI